MMKAVTGIVKGRVQGVGFRYFVLDAAESLGIDGWVRNLPDNSVEFFAQGTEKELDTFVRKVEQGPPMARVDRIFKDTAGQDGTLNGFEIRH
jgi:acylphosphatase